VLCCSVPSSVQSRPVCLLLVIAGATQSDGNRHACEGEYLQLPWGFQVVSNAFALQCAANCPARLQHYMTCAASDSHGQHGATQVA
jgi:hypothetical protein